MFEFTNLLDVIEILDLLSDCQSIELIFVHLIFLT